MPLSQFVIEALPERPEAFDVRTVPYLEEKPPLSTSGPQSHRYRCHLCGHNIANIQTLIAHCKEPSHREKVLELGAEKETATHVLKRQIELKENSDLTTRIQKLPLQTWRNNVQAELFSYLMDADKKQGEDNHHLDQARHLLETYEHLEGISLLKMAIWKNVCIMAMPNSVMNSYLAMKEWEWVGWKVNKKEMRKSNVAAIIVQRVLPFLLPSPHCTVTGAGLPEVNGTYKLDRDFNDARRYVKAGMWEGSRCKFSILLCDFEDGNQYWFISITGSSPGTNSDIDLYLNDEAETNPQVPPHSGWATCSKGEDPPPTLSYGSAHEESSSEIPSSRKRSRDSS